MPEAVAWWCSIKKTFPNILQNSACNCTKKKHSDTPGLLATKILTVTFSQNASRQLRCFYNLFWYFPQWFEINWTWNTRVTISAKWKVSSFEYFVFSVLDLQFQRICFEKHLTKWEISWCSLLSKTKTSKLKNAYVIL